MDEPNDRGVALPTAIVVPLPFPPLSIFAAHLVLVCRSLPHRDRKDASNSPQRVDAPDIVGRGNAV